MNTKHRKSTVFDFFWNNYPHLFSKYLAQEARTDALAGVCFCNLAPLPLKVIKFSISSHDHQIF